MLDLGTISTIIGAISWLHSFGKEDIKDVKKETTELLNDLSKSLVNLYDLTEAIGSLSKKASRLSDVEFVEAFENVQDYASRFYFDQSTISSARTHCSAVQRDAERIKFKLVKFLRTNIGKWDEANQHLDNIIHDDGRIMHDYDSNMSRLKQELSEVSTLLQNRKTVEARQKYEALGNALQDDLNQLREGVDRMQAAFTHMRDIVN